MIRYSVIISLPLLATVIFGCSSDYSNNNEQDTDSESETETDTDTESDTGETDPWTQTVEEYWGDAPDLDTRVELFEAIWQSLANEYACFETFDIDWDDTYDEYLPLIEQAESYGRFAQLLSQLSDDLKDPHTYVYSESVCRNSILKERPPIELTGVSSSSSVFGACVAATEEGELVVYRLDATINPIDLEVGDEIIGYDNKTWEENIQNIDAAVIPACGRTRSIQESLDYIRLSSVLMNPHLFSTLQVRRQGTGEVETIDLLDLYDAVFPDQEKADVMCTGQMPVEGIAFPQSTFSELFTEDSVTWGILPETNIGYIYVYRWLDADSALFEQAVEDLMDTDALIIDQRFNLGGRYTLVEYGMPILFNEVTPAVDYYIRDESDNYTSLALWFSTEVDADPETFYNKPIAVLTGPDAMSGGDLFPYVMAKHPYVRLFGKPTAGGFGGIKYYFDPDPYISDVVFMGTDSVMIEPITGEHLEGYINMPDTHIWLTREDIVAGTDTVVESAISWIESEL